MTLVLLLAPPRFSPASILGVFLIVYVKRVCCFFVL